MGKSQERKGPRPIFWVTGNYYDCRKMWLKVCQKLKDPNVEILDCGYNPQSTAHDARMATASDVIMMLKHRDLFDSRPRIIKLKSIPEDYTLISDYLDLVDDNNVLYIDSPFGFKKTTSKRFVSASASKFFKTIKSEGVVCDFDIEAKSVSAAIKWVEGVLTDNGRKIEPDAVRFLVELKGRNLDGLYCEVIKLCDFCLKKTIDTEAVQSCCTPLFLRQTWDYLDDLSARNFDSALQHLQHFYEVAGTEPGSSFRGDVEMLLGAVHKYFSLLLVAKDKCGEFLNYNLIVKACDSLKARTKNEDEGYNWEKNRFEAPYINANINKDAFRQAMKWSKPKVYTVALASKKIRFALRSSMVSETNRAEAKKALDAFTLLVCDKISLSQLDAIIGGDVL